MERNSLLSSSLRDYNNARDRSTAAKNTTITTTTTTKMMSQSYGGGEDYSSIAGFSWPPRCYTCSFCKREFRSAQALGGHMNVHRRDRARLRQSPPPPPPPNARYNHHHHHLHHHHHPILNLNLNPNPNPNFTTSVSPSLPSLVSPPISALSSPSSASPGELKKWVLDTLDPAPTHGKVSVRLNLEIGQVSDSKEDLDLELRLGYYY